jgi:xanthine/uracil permease
MKELPQSETNQNPCLPAGYRSGIITAITVMLGFSLLFLRSWVFELPGEWTPSSVVAAVILLISIVMELTALWRALQPRDEQPSEYRVTLRWFVISSITLLLSLIVAAFSYAHVRC